MTIDWSAIGVVEWCLIGALVLVWMYQVYFYIRYIGAVGRQKQQPCGADTSSAKGVSVIICARNEQTNLEYYLQSILTQDYEPFEVIVVNDGSEDNTPSVIERYALEDGRIKSTFVPVGTRIMSTKKLALTLGAKAARYDYLLLTDADCRPMSTHWISAMMAGFDRPNTEVVLGYGAYFEEPSAINRLIEYDTLFNGLHYLGAALTGKPYMGVGRNLAYRKSTFFDRGGFSDLMTCLAGDDDLFVNKVATGRNTAVVCSVDSITWSLPKSTWKEWVEQKKRHLSVSTVYRPATQYHLALEPVTRGLFYALLLAIGCLASPWVWVMAGVLAITRWITQGWTLRVSANHLQQPRIGWRLLIYDIVVPVITLLLMGKKSNPHRW